MNSWRQDTGNIWNRGNKTNIRRQGIKENSWNTGNITNSWRQGTVNTWNTGNITISRGQGTGKHTKYMKYKKQLETKYGKT